MVPFVRICRDREGIKDANRYTSGRNKSRVPPRVALTKANLVSWVVKPIVSKQNKMKQSSTNKQDFA
jgi:hypothetical protein